ncbi:hypothetical protein [Aliiroseovarius sp. F47248L]|uniref:hypothetical protein n=1 Tax=Aliiroseovarius sp. F47248L TaxID=2926420 RepID=UPI001FF13A5E|nr:hypothetical protein [Aliiroseovarius sp. F47248L]MCK0138654.1 hypothetical protein [Aliiroseovarius sp. F47248L]
MRTPIHSDEDIIAKGTSLTAQLGREISATDLFKALGSKGKFSRVRDLWEEHMASREEEQLAEFPLPDSTQALIQTAVSALEQSMVSMLRGEISRLTDQNIRHLALRERDFAMLESEHANTVKKLNTQITDLTQCLDDLSAAAEISETEGLDGEPDKPAAIKLARAKGAQGAAHRSPNRPVKRTLAPRKAGRPLRSKPTPEPTQKQPPS